MVPKTQPPPCKGPKSRGRHNCAAVCRSRGPQGPVPLEEVQAPWRDENRRPRENLQSSATSQRWGLLVTSCSMQTQVGPPPSTDNTRTEARLLFSRQQVTHVNWSWLCRSRSSPHPASLPSSFLPPSSPFPFPFFLLFFLFPLSLFVLSCFDAHIFSRSPSLALALSPTHPSNITTIRTVLHL